MVWPQTQPDERMTEYRPSFAERALDPFRYHRKLALTTLLAGAVLFYLGGRVMNQCFESTVVIPLPSGLLDPHAGPSPFNDSLVAAIEQNRSVQSAFEQTDAQAAWIAKLGSRAQHLFFSTHLTFTPEAVSGNNPQTLRLTAKESVPETAPVVAKAVGGAFAALLPTRTSLAATSSSAPAPAPPAAPISAAPTPAPVAPPVVTAPTPSTAPVPPPTLHLLKVPPVNSEAVQQKVELTDQLIEEENQRVRLNEDLKSLEAIDHAEPAPPPPPPSAIQTTLRKELTEARAKLDDFEKRYTDQHPDVVAQKERVLDLEARLKQVVASEAVAARELAARHSNSPIVKARVARQAEVRTELNQLDAQIAGDTGTIAKLNILIAQEADQRHSIEAQNAYLTAKAAKQAASAPATQTAPPAAIPSAPSAAARTPAQSAIDDRERAAASAEVHQLTARVQSYLKTGKNDVAPAAPASAPPASAPPASVAEPALPPPTAPTFPSPSTFLTEPTLAATALLAALLASFLSIVLAELLSRTVKSARSLERALPPDVHFLGEIPRISL